MKHRIEATGLPSYSAGGLQEGAGTCYFAERAAQFYDRDLVTATGAAQKTAAETFAVPGEGASLLFMSRADDIVLARSFPNGERAEADRKIDRLRQHWETCGIRAGRLDFVDDVHAAAKAASRAFFLCPPVFSSQVAAIIGDEQARRQRELIAMLLNKHHAARQLGDSTVQAVPGREKLSELTANQNARWVIKAAVGAGGQMVAFGDSRSDIDAVLRDSAAWGDAVFQPYVEGEEYFAFYLIDPELAGPKVMLEGASDNAAPPRCANSWSKSGDGIGVTAAAGRVFELARTWGAAPFVLGQDIRGPRQAVIDNNPRWCAYVPMLRLLAEDRGHIKTMKHLRVPASPETAVSVLLGIEPFAYDGKGGRGVVLCAAPDRPVSALVLLIVNDGDGEVERGFLQRFGLAVSPE
ncbi:hypothetical protein [uncultured Bradyrhizobium sp.]|uniref:hypothetical protein n=1 Tax=uncultured Bradyrhizobium sp. TaxID=199684 RepID=UPI0035C95464